MTTTHTSDVARCPWVQDHPGFKPLVCTHFTSWSLNLQGLKSLSGVVPEYPTRVRRAQTGLPVQTQGVKTTMCHPAAEVAGQRYDSTSIFLSVRGTEQVKGDHARLLAVVPGEFLVGLQLTVRHPPLSVRCFRGVDGHYSSCNDF